MISDKGFGELANGVPRKEDLQELDMESYCLPGLGKGQTNVVFNSLRNLCRYMYDYFEAQKDGKDFVYCQKDEETGKVIKVTIHEEK